VLQLIEKKEKHVTATDVVKQQQGSSRHVGTNNEVCRVSHGSINDQRTEDGQTDRTAMETTQYSTLPPFWDRVAAANNEPECTAE
jgi:hypothetical protein